MMEIWGKVLGIFIAASPDWPILEPEPQKSHRKMGQ